MKAKLFDANAIGEINKFLEDKVEASIVALSEIYVIVYYQERKINNIDVGKLSLREKVKFLDMCKKVNLNGSPILTNL